MLNARQSRLRRIIYSIFAFFSSLIFPYKINTINTLIRLLLFFIDYVYFETATSSPYQIRRIEELNKVRC